MRFVLLSSQHFRRERDDLHELLLAQLAGDRPEHARPDRLALVGDQDRGVVVEADVRAVPPALVPARPHDHRPDDTLAVLLDERRIRRALLDRGRDDVAETRVLACRAAAHPDARDLARARIVRHLEDGSHLDHGSPLGLGLGQDLAQTPALALRQRPRLLDANAVADLRGVGLVVRMEPARALDGPRVFRVLDAALDLDDDRLRSSCPRPRGRPWSRGPSGPSFPSCSVTWPPLPSAPGHAGTS